MKSMTGYGRGSSEDENIRVVVEVKSLNGKALRVRFNIPRLFNPLINELNRKVEEFVKRGELELHVSYRFSPNFQLPLEVNEREALKLIELSKRISAVSGKEVKVSLKDLLSFPEVLVKEEVSPEPFKETLFKALTQALEKLDEERRKEGEKLKAFFKERIKEIEKTLSELEKELPKVKELLYQRLKERVLELLKGIEVPEDFTKRVELEVAVLAERQDVSEELSRLKAHLKRFRELLEVRDEPVGKTLDFLCQEMHREINTLGNKVKEIDATEPVIKIKSEIAKIKEQVQNVE
ncbi:YicC/YloC family endoribonuclease [Thermovibrio sp.]